jgi:hypothetical protein
LDKKTFARTINNMDSRPLHLTTRAFKSIPSSFLYNLSGISPLNFKLIESAILSTYRLAATQESDIQIPEFISNILRDYNFSHPGLIDLIPRKTHYHRNSIVNFSTDNLTFGVNDPVLHESSPADTYNVFTDGPQTSSFTSGAFIVYNNYQIRHRCKFILQSFNSV